jgi:hypothetical protein
VVLVALTGLVAARALLGDDSDRMALNTTADEAVEGAEGAAYEIVEEEWAEEGAEEEPAEAEEAEEEPALVGMLADGEALSDTEVGYPRPLSTARARQLDQRGFVVPPPEVPVAQPSPDATTLALAAKAPAAAPEDAVEDSDEAWFEAPLAADRAADMIPPSLSDSEAEPASAARHETAPERIEAPPSSAEDNALPDAPEPDVASEAEAGPETGAAAEAEAVGYGGGAALPWLPMVALAIVLLSLSALLYVRARR